MNGVIVLRDADPSVGGAAGAIDMSVDFGSDEVDGIASNFIDLADVSAMTGTLVLYADIVTAATTGFVGTLEGDLTRGDTVSVLIDVEGRFVGTRAQGIFAVGAGSYSGSMGSGVLDAQIIAE
ncbi:hypothetical protein [Yoonia sp. MH D7]